MKVTEWFVNGYSTETAYKIIYPCTNTVAFSTYRKGWPVDLIVQSVTLIVSLKWCHIFKLFHFDIHHNCDLPGKSGKEEVDKCSGLVVGVKVLTGKSHEVNKSLGVSSYLNYTPKWCHGLSFECHMFHSLYVMCFILARGLKKFLLCNTVPTRYVTCSSTPVTFWKRQMAVGAIPPTHTLNDSGCYSYSDNPPILRKTNGWGGEFCIYEISIV